MIVNLFLRTFSQAMQAFMPIALSLVWFERTGDTRISSAIRRGVLVSIPATVIASWLFHRTTHAALDEAVLAAITVAVAWFFTRRVWRHAHHRASVWAVTALAALIIVRQTWRLAPGSGAA
jgi:hypothetical protein